jgi:penicillin amidase
VVKAPARRCGGSYVARCSAWCRRCWRAGIVTGTVLSVPVGGAVRIVRDEYGVPHVYASSERALRYGEGYAIGEDRLWQEP